MGDVGTNGDVVMSVVMDVDTNGGFIEDVVDMSIRTNGGATAFQCVGVDDIYDLLTRCSCQLYFLSHLSISS
jgi:hypothetical protein